MTLEVEGSGERDVWLEFARDECGEVAEVFVGRHRFTHERAAPGPDAFPHPAAWDSYAGLYRAHDPWRPLIRFIVRKGRLCMVHPLSATVEPLEPDGDSVFRLAKDERLPERIRFHAVADGVPRRVELEGFDHYRAPDVRGAWNERSE
jgi:hypothetical protein